MSWTSQRNHTIWVVQCSKTHRVIVVFDRKFFAEEYIEDHPDTYWTRMNVNEEGGETNVNSKSL